MCLPYVTYPMIPHYLLFVSIGVELILGWGKFLASCGHLWLPSPLVGWSIGDCGAVYDRECSFSRSFLVTFPPHLVQMKRVMGVFCPIYILDRSYVLFAADFLPHCPSVAFAAEPALVVYEVVQLTWVDPTGA